MLVGRKNKQERNLLAGPWQNKYPDWCWRDSETGKMGEHWLKII